MEVSTYECKSTRLIANEIADILGSRLTVLPMIINMSGMLEYVIKTSIFGRTLIHVYHESIIVYCSLSKQAKKH
jgi:hypothetical protein